MSKSKVSRLAKQFGKGKVASGQVVAALKSSGRKSKKRDLIKADSLGEDTDFPDGPDSWTDVENAYYAGELTDSQFRQLHRAAFAADTPGKEASR